MRAASEAQGGVPLSGEVALASVYEADYARLVRLASLLLDRRDDAEEVVQEAFTRTLASWGRVRGKADPRGYVQRAVVNLCHGRLRRRRLVRKLRPERPGVAHSAEHVVQANDAAGRVRAAVQRLPLRQRECVVLYYFEGYPVADTARLLDVSEGTVKTSLSRARQTLASKLKDQS